MNQHSPDLKHLEKRLIIVLGMHRSGTSAIARALQVLGVDLGGNLMPSNEAENASGFWEDLDVYRLHVDMLEALGREWHALTPLPEDFIERLRERDFLLRAASLLQTKLENVPIFGFKDPRIALLLPFWKEVFAYVGVDTSYVLALRNPISVTKSLAARNQFHVEKSAILWLMHCVSMVEGSAGARHVLVDYDILMERPEHEIFRMAVALNLTVDHAELRTYCTEFLQAGLRHSICGAEDLRLNDFTGGTIRDLYLIMRRAALGELALDAPPLIRCIRKSRRELQQWGYLRRFIDELCLTRQRAVEDDAVRNARIVQLEIALDGARKDINVERQARERRDYEYSRLSAVGADQETQLSTLNQELQLSRVENERLRESLARSADSAFALKLQIGTLNATALDQHSWLNRVNHELEEKREWIVTLTNSLHVAEDKALALADELTSLRSASAAFKTEIDDKQSRLDTAQEELLRQGALNEKLLQNIGRYEEKVLGLTAKTNTLQCALARRDSELDEARCDLRQRTTQLEALLYQNLQQDGKVLALAADIGLLKNAATERELQLAEARNSVADCQAECEDLTRLIGEQGSHIAALGLEHESSLRKAEELAREAVLHIDALAGVRMNESVLKKELENAQQRARSLNDHGDNLQRLLQQRDMEMTTFRACLVTGSLHDLESLSATLFLKTRQKIESLGYESASARAAHGCGGELDRVLQRDGTDFIDAAYGMLLGRMGDDGGMQYYRKRLRTGSPKIEILMEIVRSEEGRRAGRIVPGLRRAMQLHQLTRIPILGKVVAAVVGAESSSTHEMKLRAMQQQLADTVSSAGVVLKEIGADAKALHAAAAQARRDVEFQLCTASREHGVVGRPLIAQIPSAISNG